MIWLTVKAADKRRAVLTRRETGVLQTTEDGNIVGEEGQRDVFGSRTANSLGKSVCTPVVGAIR
jgi:hypothetical protein